MITEVQIKTAINTLLKNTFPGTKVYGKDVHEGYTVPCFFTELRLISDEPVNINLNRKIYNAYATYFDSGGRPDEEGQMEKLAALKAVLIGADPRRRKYTLHIGDRYIRLTEFSYDYVGEANDKLQISMSFEFDDYFAPNETYQNMQHVYMKEEVD